MCTTNSNHGTSRRSRIDNEEFTLGINSTIRPETHYSGGMRRRGRRRKGRRRQPPPPPALFPRLLEPGPGETLDGWLACAFSDCCVLAFLSLFFTATFGFVLREGESSVESWGEGLGGGCVISFFLIGLRIGRRGFKWARQWVRIRKNEKAHVTHTLCDMEQLHN